MGSKATSDYRKRRKENLIAVCGGQCCLCNYDKAISALEFHHIVPDEKLYGLSEKGTCHDLEQDLKEVQKCILVCANCHREIHEGFYDDNELIQAKRYNENIANELRMAKKQLYEKKEYLCKNCGKVITRYSKSQLCDKCSHEATRYIQRPNREELKQLIRTLPFTVIGEKYGVSDNAIKKWCKSENLPFRKLDIKKITDDEWKKI